MIFYFIPLIIIIASLSAIIYIVVKKLPNLAAINIESIAAEKENRVRNRIMIERLSRSFLKFKKTLEVILRPLLEDISLAWKNFYQKTIELEKENLKKAQLASRRSGPLKKIDINQEIKDKLKPVKKLLADNHLDRAEEQCIAVVGLDPKNLDAYEFLTQIYREKKEYKRAREICRHFLKLLNKINNSKKVNGSRDRLANAYADLGTIYELEGKYSNAVNNYQKAVGFEPNNPRFLDLLLKISIMLKNKPLAKEVFAALKKANPDNKKLSELETEVSSLSNN